jgi:hypothetical protein
MENGDFYPLIYEFLTQALSNPATLAMILLAGLVAWALYLLSIR